MIKLIGTDFDGTLLNNKKKISTKTKQKLIELKEKGYIIVGITGRILETIKEDIDINIFDYIIYNNGVNIQDVKNNKNKYIDFINKETANNITELLTDYKDIITYATYNKYYNYPTFKSKNEKTYIKKITSIYEIEEKISIINIYAKDDEEIKKITHLLKTHIKNINVYVSQDSFDTRKWIIIHPKNINKNYTLEKLRKKINLKNDEIIFFGDGLNDLELISSKCITVAMKNALEEIKEKANYISEYTNNEDGVIKFLEKYLKEENMLISYHLSTQK